MNTRKITGALAGLGLTTGLTLSAVAGSAQATIVPPAAARHAPVVAFASPHFSGGGVRPDGVYFTTRRHQPSPDTMRVDVTGNGWAAWTTSRAYDPHAFEEFYNQPFTCHSGQSTDRCGSLTLNGVRRVHDPHHLVNGTRYFSQMQFRSNGKITKFTYTSQRGWFRR
jgi:hypothetical protein